jgi:hypothetical protein
MQMSIETEQERLLQAPRRGLDHARRDPETWTELACVTGHDAEGRAFDRNRAARFGVLWALQYDRRDRDLPLLRFLLKQQIAYYREVVPTGLVPDLPLAGFLLAEHRHVEDIWLHWQAKSISFDTALGYHLFHLLTPGVAAVHAAVRASSHPDRDRILSAIDPARHTDAAVEEWLTQQQERFPPGPDGENLKTWAHHAARLGEGEASRLFILGWAESQPRTGDTLNTLQFHLAQLGYVREAVAVQKEAVAVSGTAGASMKASSLLTLVRLERRAGDFPGALHALQETEIVLPADKNGFGQGLWRHYVKECFLLIPTAPDEATARRLLAPADQHLQGVPRLWMDGVLSAALTAAEHLHATEMVHRYQALIQAADRDREDEIRKARHS